MPNLYETLLIVTPEADDEGINAVIGDLRALVDANGGTMLQARIWERNRKLAYQVKGKTEGHYVLLHSEGSGDLPQVLKAKMRLDEAVIRFIVVRLEDVHEADARKEIAELEDDQSAVIAAQKTAAERRAVARAAAATRTTAEVVAAEVAIEAEQAAAAAEPAIVGVDSSEADPSAEETPAVEVGFDVEAESKLEDETAAEVDAADHDEPVAEVDAVDHGEAASEDSTGPGERIIEGTAPQADADEAVADEEEKES